MKGVYLAYISYPFSRHPRKYTRDVCRFAKEIMTKHPNVFIIVPHTSVDTTMFGPPRRCMKDYGNRDNTVAAKLEFTILSKIDIFIQGVPDDPSVSMGCIWEHAFCLWMNSFRKKQIRIITLEEVLKNGI